MTEDLNLGLGLEQLEIVLKGLGQYGSVERVISMEAESALPKGENYLSTVYRLCCRVVLDKGRTANRALILKVLPQERGKKELVTSMGVFKSETMIYTRVLREMEALMEEFGDTSEVLWCRLVHYEPYSSLLLEDLKGSGFKMTRRQDLLDLEHSLLVLRSLGRFHAMSKILEQRGIISRDDYKPFPMLTDNSLIRYFIHYGLQTLAKAMEEHWGPEWYDVAQKLKVPCEVLEEKMMELGEIDDSKFNCLNHGDCWSNNMMFKYDWQNRPYTMKFVDWQLGHYNSAACDIYYAIYCSVHPSVRRPHLDRLFNAYLDAFEGTCQRYDWQPELSGEPKPTLEFLKSEKDRLIPLHLFSLVNIHAMVCNESGEVYDPGKAVRTKGKQGLSPDLYDLNYRDMAGYEWRVIAEKMFQQWDYGKI